MKKTWQKMMSVLFVFVLFACFSVVAMAADDAFTAQVTVAGTQMDIRLWQNEKDYYLFLPADAETDDVKFVFDESKMIYLDYSRVIAGAAINLSKKDTYDLSINSNSGKLYVMQSENLPSLHITTESGSMEAVHANKDHKEPASVVIVNQGEIVIDQPLEYIKGRGNATWFREKKPYNIKFEDKTDLFGMGKEKKWSLLANHLDKSFLHNDFAFSLATALGIPYTSAHINVDLFVNNEYYGTYTLCESVEVGKNRVNINDLEGDTEDVNENDLDEYAPGGDQSVNAAKLMPGTQKWLEIPNNPENITGGYLLEYELASRYVSEASGFISDRGQPVVVKAPEYASEAQVKYISALYQQFEDAVFSPTGYNSLNKHYSEYIDLDSFVTMYVFQEYVKNLDAAITSFYIYKDADSDLFVAAPVWDFDNALGNYYPRYGIELSDPDTWWASVIYYWEENLTENLPTILNALCRQSDFQALSISEWNDTFAPILTEEYFDGVEETIEQITASATMNAVRWKLFSTADPTSAKNAYLNYTNGTFLPFINQRKAFLDKGLASDSVRLFYDANGGSGAMFNETALQTGDRVVLKDNVFKKSLYVFNGWNTQPDGNGTAYAAGDSIEMGTVSITLYAQWEPMNPAEQLGGFMTMVEQMLNFFRIIIEWYKGLYA